jgi:acetate kinase
VTEEMRVARGGLVLAINSGSSSIKFALFDNEGGVPAELARGTVNDKSDRGFEAMAPGGKVIVERTCSPGTPTSAILSDLLEWIDEFAGGERLTAVGHRIVHGGDQFLDPVELTGDRIDALEALAPLAPLHQARCLEPVRVIAALRPELLQVGCFDTAFHQTIDATVRRYGVPRRFEDAGIRKYGFHGLSYEHIAERLTEMCNQPSSGTVVAHLGSGASLCAVRDGRSYDTSMGFSVLDGLPMATRCGSIDPGVILYMQRHMGLSAAEIEDLLYHDSGLLGVSGISGDMRALIDSPDPRALEAVDLFAFHVSRQVALMANTLGGIDRLVFTGGIGEHQGVVRADVCARLAWLGIGIDKDANDRSAACISAGGSRVSVLVIPADEEGVIARHALAVRSALQNARVAWH